MGMQSLTLQERKELFLVALDTFNGNISAACEAVGMSRAAYYKWMQVDEKFAERYRNTKLDTIEQRLDVAESKLDENIEHNDTPSIKYFLDNHGGKRGYGKKRVEVDFNFNHPLMPKGEYPDEPIDVDSWEVIRDKQEELQEDQPKLLQGE